MRVFEWAVASALLLLALFLLFQDSLLLPSRYGNPPRELQGVGVYLVAGLPLAISLAMALQLGFGGRYKRVGLALLCMGGLTFVSSLFFVA